MIDFLDYMTCEVLFASDVNSQLDDSWISCAPELKFICLPCCFFSGAILENT